MKNTVTRGLGLAATLLMALTSLGVAAPASAAETDVGWLRISPVSGKSNVAIQVLTQEPCPGGESLVVRMAGPNVPAGDPDVGFLVGNAAIKVYPPTTSGQLLVPLSSTFRDWFALNGVTVAAGKTYTVSLVCRDKFKSSLVYGVFSGQVTFDKSGGFRAVGAAAKPFDAALEPRDPSEGIVPIPSVPAETPKPGASGTLEPTTSAEPEGSANAVPSGGPESPTAEIVDGGTVAADRSTASTPRGSPVVFLFGGLALISVLAGAAWLLQRSRRPVGNHARGSGGAPNHAVTPDHEALDVR